MAAHGLIIRGGAVIDRHHRVLTDHDKPDAFRMVGTTEDWWKAAQQS